MVVLGETHRKPKVAGDSDRAPEVAIPAAYSKLFRTAPEWAHETEPEMIGARAVKKILGL